MQLEMFFVRTSIYFSLAFMRHWKYDKASRLGKSLAFITSLLFFKLKNRDGNLLNMSL